MAEGIIGGAITLILLFLKEIFIKGKNVKAMEQIEKRLCFVEEEFKIANQRLTVINEHEIKLDHVNRDYVDLKDAIKELTQSVNGVNQSNASLKATISGLAQLLDNGAIKRRR